jgi:hypothetical protein
MNRQPSAGTERNWIIEVENDDPETLMDAYAARGWGDGLPLVAPTPERVDAMLATATGDPDEPLAVLQPRRALVTRRAVAVNAVLAGCTPDVFPVVLTAVRALCRPEVNLRGVNATTHPVAPLVIVHGEVVERAGFNAGVGAFGPGNRPNATVGRAVRLVLLHLGGARPGSGDAATQGQPSKYSYCIAENERESPWESYARSRGVDAPSAVTVHCGENPHNVHDQEGAGDPRLILEKLASAMTSLALNNAPISQGEWFVVLGPEHAHSLANGGLERRDIASYLFDHARIPAGTFRRHFSELAWAEWMKLSTDDHELPMTEHPDNICVVVAGGPGKHSSLIPSWGMTRSVTVPIEA